MNKKERQALVKNLVDAGELNEDQIKLTVSEKAGVKPETVAGDLKELYPENGNSKAPTTATLLKLKPSSNSEEANKGRVSEYEVPLNEQDDTVHVEIEKVQFDRISGEKQSKPTVQKFNVRAWNNFRQTARQLGYTYVRVLWAPEGVDTTVVELKKRKDK